MFFTVKFFSLSLKMLTFEGNSRQSRVENRSCSVNYHANVRPKTRSVHGWRIKKTQEIKKTRGQPVAVEWSPRRRRGFVFPRRLRNTLV